jgi:hypothetical protein
MAFESDKQLVTGFTRPQIRSSEVPNFGVTESDFAFLAQRTSVNSSYLGILTAQWVLKSVIFKNEISRLDKIEVLLNNLICNPILLTSSPTEGLTGSNLVNLDLTKGSFSIELLDEFLCGKFYSTNASAAWNEADEQILNAGVFSGLHGHVALIGGETQTFEYFGVRSPGPFVFRNNNRMVQITKSGNVFEVSDMLLQLLDTPTNPIAERTIYTTSAALTPQNRDLVLVDGPGDIYLPDNPIDGFKFTLDDRKFGRLGLNRNSVIPPTGVTIGSGQTTATINNLTPLTWGDADAGSFSTYIYEAANKNWCALLTREVEGTGITQSTANPPIFTTNADTIAAPYQSYYLNGNGNILIYLLTRERQFIDISWDAGATWIVRVICPVGYTILGDFEDLEINTARTSATHHKLVLKAGNDFGVTA